MSEHPKPNFTGFWKADVARSVLRGRAPLEMLVKIEHREPTLVQAAVVSYAPGVDERLSFTYATDGSESTNVVRGMSCVTRARWDGAVLVIETRMKTPDRELHFSDHWSLSPDGTTLTMAHPDDDLAGQITILEPAPPEAAARFSGSRPTF